MLKTKITEMFGIKYPIICGGMMFLCGPKLCAAISNAGGMGCLAAGIWENEADFRNAINETRKLTDKPFTVNLTLLPSVRLKAENYGMWARVCAEENVAAMEISGTPLDKALGMGTIEMLKKAGVKLFHKVGSVRHAVHAEKVGYDGIFAAGIEEGGHPLNDDVTTMVLTPRIVESVKIPVVTAGGIGDGQTMAAALVLGAQGVMMASRFLAIKEIDIHENIKQELIRRQEHETTLYCQSIGLQGRGLKNKLIAEVKEIEKKGGGLEALLPLISGLRVKEAWKTGDPDNATLMVGQSIGLIKDIPMCQELFERMEKEAKEQLNKVGLMVS